MKIKIGQDESDAIDSHPASGDYSSSSKKGGGTVNHTSGMLGRFLPDNHAPLIASTPAEALPSPWPPSFSELWPMQMFANDMVGFAEELHRSLQHISVDNAHPGSNLHDFVGQLTQIEQSLIVLLARNGISRNDPAGSKFNSRYHRQIGEQPSLNDISGTVMQTLTSTWTLNDRLLRTTTVVVSAAGPDERPSGNPADANGMNGSTGFPEGRFA